MPGRRSVNVRLLCGDWEEGLYLVTVDEYISPFSLTKYLVYWRHVYG